MIRTMILAVAATVALSTPVHAFSNHAVPGALWAKVSELKAACGAKVVSAHRAGARTPSGHVSNHALGKAVDLTGNASCMYARLTNWPGGVTTDYACAGHIHLSYNPGGMEWGQRFRHAHCGGGWRHARRGAGQFSAKRRGGTPLAQYAARTLQRTPHWVPGAL